MFPEVFHLGPLHLRSFGVMLALAFLVGSWIALGQARKRGLDESKLLNLVLVILVSSIVGARGMYVLTHLSEVCGRGSTRSRCGKAGSRSTAGSRSARSPASPTCGRPGCRWASPPTCSPRRSRWEWESRASAAS
jgi:hypothetical protein